MGRWRDCLGRCLLPQPSTLNDQCSTLNPQSSILHPTPSTLKTRHSTLNPQPCTMLTAQSACGCGVDRGSGGSWVGAGGRAEIEAFCLQERHHFRNPQLVGSAGIVSRWHRIYLTGSVYINAPHLSHRKYLAPHLSHRKCV